ncbi:MAG: type IV secretory system conjugative DNA transfer family protein [Clostridia bacterium]|nr:type IV secretory system conjugative DNA transfer family protein [Clostridia bacterium]
MRNFDLFSNYENSRLKTVSEFTREYTTIPYSKLGEVDCTGIPLCIKRDETGEIQVTMQPYSHTLCIGATRSGKTTSFLIPTINVLMKGKDKPNMVISDPKGELSRETAARFEEEGYRIITLDFVESDSSDCWNPLTKIYDIYAEALSKAEAFVPVLLGDDKDGVEFEGKFYPDYESAKAAYTAIEHDYMTRVEYEINKLASKIVPVDPNHKDPYWDRSARSLFKAIIYAMLEDIATGTITRDNFSLGTMLEVFDAFSDGDEKNFDKGYFTSRGESSKAYKLARNCILEQANNTRKCIISVFIEKMNIFRDIAIRRVTCTNTFNMEELDGDTPTVIFLEYRDEENSGYEIISLFLSCLYTELIAIARKKDGSLSRPFLFLLDEFGNLPQFGNDEFHKIISACASRNVFFVILLQSYAQLNHVYGESCGHIIRDNLSTHIYIGSNNTDTVGDFSKECGEKTIISPVYAILNGEDEHPTNYTKEVVPLVPVSKLKRLKVGECVITQLREDVLWSFMERSYLCPEFCDKEKRRPKTRVQKVDFAHPKYHYKKEE